MLRGDSASRLLPCGGSATPLRPCRPPPRLELSAEVCAMTPREREGGARGEPAPGVPRGPDPRALAGARRGDAGRVRAAGGAQALAARGRLRRARGRVRGGPG